MFALSLPQVPLGGHCNVSPVTQMTIPARLTLHYPFRDGKSRTRRVRATARMSVLCLAAGSSSDSAVLTKPDGSKLELDKDSYTFGTAASADIRIQGDSCSEEHARLERRSGRLCFTGVRPIPQLM